MIQIRYKNLAPGLHGKAECLGRRTTIFLVPGLTSAQRKAALRRLRQEARRKCGPQLPLPQLVIALAVDRVRVGFRGTGAVIRLHPAGSILSTAAVGCFMVLFVLASVSAQMIHQPGTAGSGAPTVGTGAGSPSPGAVPKATRPDPAGSSGSGGLGGLGGAGGAGASGKLPRTLVVSSSGPGVDGTGDGSGASAGSGPSSGCSRGGGISVCVNIGSLGS